MWVKTKSVTAEIRWGDQVLKVGPKPREFSDEAGRFLTGDYVARFHCEIEQVPEPAKAKAADAVAEE